MTDRLEHIVPAATTQESLREEITQLRRWLEGFVDEKGIRNPGLIESVGELYAEMKLRRERREQVGRVLATGSALAIFGFVLNWVKDHLK